MQQIHNNKIPTSTSKGKQNQLFKDKVRVPGAPKLRPGLRKLRNTCYMNSVLQCLFHIQDLRTYFLKGEWKNVLKLNEGQVSVCSAWNDLLKELQGGVGESISPHDFKTVLHTTGCWSFARNEQQDAYEFLISLLDKLHQELNKQQQNVGKRRRLSSQSDKTGGGGREWNTFLSSNSSIITDLFFGQQRTTATCTKCGKQSINYEPFLGLSLAIPEQDEGNTLITLQDCLDLYLKQELITDWDCPSCKDKVDAHRHIELVRLPKYLIIKLKRTIFGEAKRGRLTQKVFTLVHFPVNGLDLGLSVTFDLIAVVEHIGQEISGHYTATCKDLANGDWAFFNDSRVHEMNEDEIVDSKAVILFYKSKQ